MKVLFLDIDGVLQPFSKSNRPIIYLKEMKQLIDDLSEKYNIDYHKYHKEDVKACYAYWDKEAVERIRTILDKTGAKIVVSSDWRANYWTWEPQEKMLEFLALHDLDKYHYGETEAMYHTGDKDPEVQANWEKLKAELEEKYKDKVDSRVVEITKYLMDHPEVNNYVVVDDLNLEVGLEGHFIRTWPVISDDDVTKAIEILMK